MEENLVAFVSLPGSSVQGISQERILEPVAISCSRGSHRQGVELASPALAGGFSIAELPEKSSSYIHTRINSRLY